MSALFDVRLTSAARRDLEEIFDFVSKEASRATAVKLIARIDASISKLRVHAMRFRERKELGAGRRANLVSPYIVFYRVVGDVVFVQRVLHGARNITAEQFGTRR